MKISTAPPVWVPRLSASPRAAAPDSRGLPTITGQGEPDDTVVDEWGSVFAGSPTPLRRGLEHIQRSASDSPVSNFAPLVE
jgi:hypothetical protein